MFFLMICHHHPGVDAQRDALRPQHRDWVATGGKGRARGDEQARAEHGSGPERQSRTEFVAPAREVAPHEREARHEPADKAAP